MRILRVEHVDPTPKDIMASLGYIEQYASKLFDAIEKGDRIPVGFVDRMAELAVSIKPSLKRLHLIDSND